MMTIHVVQQDETINSIAELYGVPADRIILENELITTDSLVLGQTIVITFPKQTYVVQEGDTLLDIANSYGVPLFQILRNNPFLSGREYIYPGETLVISYYDTAPRITTNGYANVFINNDILIKTLPSLTYLSILGYRIIAGGEIAEIDDTNLIQTAKNYGVAPLMILSTLSVGGEENIEALYNVLNNENLMDRLIDNLIIILKKKGYYGANLTYQLLNNLTLPSYETLNTKVYNRLKNEGLACFITISPNTIFTADSISFERVNYEKILQECDGAVVLNYLWGTYLGPPSPLSSISKINDFLDYLIPQTEPGKLMIGMPLIAYDWELPYIIGLSKANSLTIDGVITLARQYGSTIQFDEKSQTPYFTYNESIIGITRLHVVWFVDARSIDAILKVISERGLNGSGIWNIMNYYPQLWLVTNTQYEIAKILEAF
ncbi:MAG: LysM peptidoglycan-binding domain-containing protein [Mobilitalea sp.]